MHGTRAALALITTALPGVPSRDEVEALVASLPADQRGEALATLATEGDTLAEFGELAPKGSPVWVRGRLAGAMARLARQLAE